MTPIVFILVLIGVCYVSDLLMRFIVWLDSADKCEEDALCDSVYDTGHTNKKASGGTVSLRHKSA